MTGRDAATPSPAGVAGETDPSVGRAARVAGLAAVTGNVLGVAFLRDVPSPYRPGDVPAWFRGLLAQPVAAQLSAWCFVVGLVALAVFFVLVAVAVRPASRGTLLAGAGLAAIGAAVNAVGSVAPLAAIRFLQDGGDPSSAAAAKALLGLALMTDASFNLLLGLGLVALNLSLGRGSGWPAWVRALGVVAGLVSLPVAGQSVSDGFARLLLLSGPLWLVWIGAAAVAGLWQRPPTPATL